MWNADTPWVDPLIAAAAMGAVTSTLFFHTNVMKLGLRCYWPAKSARWRV